MVAPLHVVTDDEVLAAPAFLETASLLARSFGGDVALHLRGHRTPARRLHAHARELEAVCETTGTPLLLADRVDVALATERAGVRLGARSIPVAAARRLLPDRLLARSVHSVEEGEAAARDGADLLVVGTIWETPSHPGRAGAGTGLLRRMAGRVAVPIVAIGGVTPARAAEALAAGAAGVAALRGVWGAEDAVAAAGELIRAMGGVAAAHGGPA